MPRVVNGAVACVLLACLSPLPGRIGDEGWLVRVVLAFTALPVLLVALACLASCLRPGVLGRTVRRLRR